MLMYTLKIRIKPIFQTMNSNSPVTVSDDCDLLDDSEGNKEGPRVIVMRDMLDNEGDWVAMICMEESGEPGNDPLLAGLVQERVPEKDTRGGWDDNEEDENEGRKEEVVVLEKRKEDKDKVETETIGSCGDDEIIVVASGMEKVVLEECGDEVGVTEAGHRPEPLLLRFVSI